MAMAPSISLSSVGRSLGSLLSWEVLSNSPAAKRSEITKILRITAVRSILPVREFYVLPQCEAFTKILRTAAIRRTTAKFLRISPGHISIAPKNTQMTRYSL